MSIIKTNKLLCIANTFSFDITDRNVDYLKKIKIGTVYTSTELAKTTEFINTGYLDVIIYFIPDLGYWFSEKNFLLLESEDKLDNAITDIYIDSKRCVINYTACSKVIIMLLKHFGIDEDFIKQYNIIIDAYNYTEIYTALLAVLDVETESFLINLRK